MTHSSWYLGFPDSSVGKESTCNAGDPGLIPRSGWLHWRRDRLPILHWKSHWRRDKLPTPVFPGFPCDSPGKETVCNVGDLGLILGLGRSPGEGNGNPLQYSCLENPVDRGAWQATVQGSQKIWTQRQTHKEGRQPRENRTEMMHLQAKECKRLLVNCQD